MARDTLARWDCLSTQVERLDDLAHALDTWYSWAQGQPVADAALADVVKSLRAVCNEWTQSLALTTEDHLPSISRPRSAAELEIERPGIGIDF